jgi:hypothetical protein
MNMTRRLFLSLAVGLWGATLCLSHFSLNHLLGTAGDLHWPLRGAQLLLAGVDPYGPTFAVPEVPYYFANRDPLFYPLPALMLLAPFTSLPPTVVAVGFIFCSTVAVGYYLAEGPWDRLLSVVSAPFVFACAWGQWTPLLLLIALTTSAAPLALCKPSTGLALFLYRPTVRGILLAAAVLLVSLAIWPMWPWAWRANLTGQQYVIPLLQPLGLLVLLALRYWRVPETRLLLVLAATPQNLWFYDQLPLAFIPQRRITRLLFAIVSYLRSSPTPSPTSCGIPVFLPHSCWFSRSSFSPRWVVCGGISGCSLRPT